MSEEVTDLFGDKALVVCMYIRMLLFNFVLSMEYIESKTSCIVCKSNVFNYEAKSLIDQFITDDSTIDCNRTSVKNLFAQVTFVLTMNRKEKKQERKMKISFKLFRIQKDNKVFRILLSLYSFGVLID
jgi:hypothetical protein